MLIGGLVLSLLLAIWIEGCSGRRDRAART